MRATIIKGIEDDVNYDLGSDVMLIGSIIEIGKALDALVYEARLTGAEVLELFNKIGRSGELDDDIVKDNHYILKAYDY